MHPLLILSIGVAIVVAAILVLRLNAFLALIAAALVVSLLSPVVVPEGAGNVNVAAEKVERVAGAFGKTAGSIGIVIAMAAVIGRCMMDSGAADRIVRAFCRLLGAKRMPLALLSSGFVLSIPVFFDTVFYLLLPLARSLFRSTGKNYILYLVAIAGGAMITHNLVPPTPGPLFVAESLGVPVGMMMLVGGLIAIFVAPVVWLGCLGVNLYMSVPMRPIEGEGEDDLAAQPIDESHLPSLGLAVLPILLPIVLISARTVMEMSYGGKEKVSAAGWTATVTVLGDKNLALTLSAAVSIGILLWVRRLPLAKLKTSLESALLSGGLIVLITAAGGAFGGALQQCGIKEYIQRYMAAGDTGQIGLLLMLTAFGIAAVLKTSLGSSTVAAMTTVGVIASLHPTGEMLGFHPVYLATAIGGGACVGAWMNDSGFWIYTKLGGLTEWESLKSWTVVHALFGLATLGVTVLLSQWLPLV